LQILGHYRFNCYQLKVNCSNFELLRLYSYFLLPDQCHLCPKEHPQQSCFYQLQELQWLVPTAKLSKVPQCYCFKSFSHLRLVSLSFKIYSQWFYFLCPNYYFQYVLKFLDSLRLSKIHARNVIISKRLWLPFQRVC